MKIPLGRRLKRRAHVDVAVLQDELVRLVYETDGGAVLHGGTAVWRCYGGSRFSEDLDFYAKGLAGIKGKLANAGLRADKLKVTENALYSKITDGTTEVRLEANTAIRKHGVVAAYENADGSVTQILTLAPEELLLEKAAAYSNRRLIRDLYDVNHLGAIAAPNASVRKEMRPFAAGIRPPLDEENLKAIVYSGNVPTFTQLAEAVRRRWL